MAVALAAHSRRKAQALYRSGLSEVRSEGLAGDSSQMRIPAVGVPLQRGVLLLQRRAKMVRFGTSPLSRRDRMGPARVRGSPVAGKARFGPTSRLRGNYHRLRSNPLISRLQP